jgi:hypothetical protein
MTLAMMASSSSVLRSSFRRSFLLRSREVLARPGAHGLRDTRLSTICCPVPHIQAGPTILLHRAIWSILVRPSSPTARLDHTLPSIRLIPTFGIYLQSYPSFGGS